MGETIVGASLALHIYGQIACGPVDMAVRRCKQFLFICFLIRAAETHLMQQEEAEIMKWNLSVVVAIAILISVVGCAAPAAPATPQTIVVTQEVEVVKTVVVTQAPAVKPKLSIWFFDSVSPEETNWMLSTIYQFAAENDVDISVYHDSEQAFIPKISAAVETGQMPDLWRTHGSDLPGYLKAAVLADVSDVLAQMNTQAGGLSNGILEAETLNGKQWGIPYQLWADAVYVRKDLLEAKGLQPPKTYEDMAKIAAAVTDLKKPIYGWGMMLSQACSSDSVADFLSILWSFGGSVWSADGKTVTLKSPETMKALDFIKGVWDAGGIAPDAVNWDCYGNNAAYLNGTAAMIKNAGSVRNAMIANDPDLMSKTIIIPDPAGPAGQYNYTSYEPWVMSSASKQPEIAKKFLLWLYDPARQLEYMHMMAGFNFPVYKDHAKDPMWQEPGLKAFLDSSVNSKTGGWPGPTTAWQLEGERQGVYQVMLGKILIDKMDPAKAVDQAVAALEQIRDSLSK
jgi:multiple sugar transport system substrate-binding protein